MAEQLQGLGRLSETGAGALAAETQAEARDFQSHIAAAIQAASPHQPGSPLQADQPLLAPPQPTIAYLVRLKVSSDRLAAEDAGHQLEKVLAWLQQTGEVIEYEWLPQAYAYRVLAHGDLVTLRHQPEVLSIETFSDQAVQAARTAAEKTFRAAAPLATPLKSLDPLAYTPTVPTISTYLYENYIYAQSTTNTDTVFTLTTSGGTPKNDPANTSFGWSWSGSYYYGWA